MVRDAAGLEVIDKLFGGLFTCPVSVSPMVFSSLPSLLLCCATLETLLKGGIPVPQAPPSIYLL